MSDPALAEVISAMSFAFGYTQLSADLVCIYDILVTFDLEVDRIWPLPFTTMKFLFFLNRYHRIPKLVFDALFSYSPGAFTTSTIRCELGIILPGIIDIIGFTITTVFSALRVLAIWGYSRVAQFLCILILVIGLTTPCFNIYRMTVEYALSDRIRLPHDEVCLTGSKISGEEVEILALLTRSLAALCEVIVLLATWAKTYTIWQESKRVGLRAPITTLLLRDGTIYFGLMMVMNVAAVALDVVRSPGNNEATAYFSSFSAILVSRMMLNLRGGTSSAQKCDINHITSLEPEDKTTVIFGHIGMPVSYSSMNSLTSIELGDRGNIVQNPLSVGLFDHDSDHVHAAIDSDSINLSPDSEIQQKEWS